MADTEVVERVTAGVAAESSRFRLPLGITLTAALLATLGLGSIGAGAFLLFFAETPSAWLVATAVAAGPAILYLSYQLLRRAPWTWRTLIAVLILLTLSSIVRLAVTPGLPIAPVGEILVEVGGLFYLTRQRVRNLFTGTR